MMIPVRCFTCGRVIGSDYQRFVQRTDAGEDAKAVMDDLGVDRVCCRRMIMGHVQLIHEAAIYE
ncbi:MAG: DNA-directed RNA polymerase subunit N [Euryarchaeota archaeon]|nr:DNA-directed RNA polymerase subunit N [Euryarchaeota archaeon]